MPFHDVHTVRPGDNLTTIGRSYGFDNPGPIWGFPPNQALFRGRSANLIRPGERVHVPYHPDLLRKIIATSQYLMAELAQDVGRIMAAQDLAKRELEGFLFKVDAANFLANVGLGMGSLVVKGARGAEMSGKEALLWLAESRATIGGNMTTLAIPAPTAPRRDFRFWVRHALGPWNPSFWASVVAAIKEGDVNLYLYGADATAYEKKQAIKRQADTDLEALRRRVADAQTQLAQPYYGQRI